MGEAYEQELEELKASVDRVSGCDDGPLHHLLATRACRCASSRSRDDGLALCEGGAEVMVDLVGAGRARATTLLVHAGVALAEARRMRFVDEYRDAELGRALAGEILATVEPGRHYKVMEVCGGHTHTIYKYGVDDLLPENVELVHGPGCPVCVIPMGRVDDGDRGRADEPGVIFTCFGDMMRVPGGDGTLLDAKARGRRRPDGLLAARRAADRAREPRPRGRLLRHRLRDDGAVDRADAACARRPRASRNFSCFCNHVTIVPPLRALLESPDLRLDGFIGPGHVCTVVGARPFEFIPADYGKPIVISGFEPLDLLQSVHMILRQLAEGRCEVENQYTRVVPYEGNPQALRGAGRGVRAAAALRVARARLHLAQRPEAVRRATPTSTPSCASRCRACASPTRRRASAARC